MNTSDTVLTSIPYTIIVNEVSIKNVCAFCFTYRGEDVEHHEFCSNCNEAWYCNEECKTKHFEEIHGLECQYVAVVKKLKLSSNFTLTKLRSLIRLLIRRYLENEKLVEIRGPSFLDVESLIAHGDYDEESEILIGIRQILDPKYLPEDANYILKLISSSECNQFGLWSPQDDLLGLSLHPSASFFNHSCLPNCYSEWNGINLVFRTLYPISSGNELTISYIDAHNSTKTRRNELRNAYYFECSCPRCVPISEEGVSRSHYDAFYQRYLRCPKGPGLMRLEQPLPKPVLSVSNQIKKKKHKKKSKIQTIDQIDLPEKIPFGYEIRSCMTCSIYRCSPTVPSLENYLKLFNIYEPKIFLREQSQEDDD